MLHDHVTRILADKKNEGETQQRSSFLQILMFQNHLMINDSCVRKEG